MIDSFDWARPWWLLALPAGIALAWAWWRAQVGAGKWRALVDPELLSHIVGRAPASSARFAAGLAILVLTLVCAALAGPLWRSHPVASPRDSGARVVVLDLSPSMDAIDVAPSRLERAREASAALLGEASGARLALVVFAADAFHVAPLTTDPATLVHLLQGLETATVPRPGSRPDLGLEMARSLLKEAGVARGDVILVGDSAGDARALEAARALASAGFELSVVAVATAHGGPVRLKNGALAHNDAGEIVVAKPDLAALERLARTGGGRFRLLAANGDVPRFASRAHAAAAAAPAPSGPVPRPQDGGPWLALLALPFAALAFRRGWLACCAAIALALPAPPADAFDWSDLWRRPEQQAATAFRGAPPSANERLLGKVGADSSWHAILLYRARRFDEAAAHFAVHDTADAHYNRGNALARDGDFESAIAAYDAALARSPAMQDALFNRSLVREALARRSAEPDYDEGAQPGNRKRARSSSAGRPGASGAAGDQAADALRRGGDERSLRGGRALRDGAVPEERDAGKRAHDSSRSAELRRLEQLLSQVTDDSGSLLANRFARHLRTRGTPSRDTGARW
jgi:Ca-activated chloride channel family protein